MSAPLRRAVEQRDDALIDDQGAAVGSEHHIARPFDLPAEAEDVRRVVAQLVGTLERVGQVHNFAKGMGLAAPQINMGGQRRWSGRRRGRL